jgi:hypothetical protein
VRQVTYRGGFRGSLLPGEQALDSETSSIPQAARPDLRSKVKAELAASRIKIRNLDQAIIRADNPEGLGESVEKSINPANETPERDVSIHHAVTPAFKTLRHETSRSTMASGTSDLSRRASGKSGGGGSKSLLRSARGAQIEDTGTGNPPESPLSSHLPSMNGALSHLHRDVSHWSLVSTTYGGGSQSGFSERQNETGRDVTYEEQMDPSVTIELVRKAQQSLEQLVHIRQKEASPPISVREVGPHIADLTRFARLSPSVIDNIDFVKLVEA